MGGTEVDEFNRAELVDPRDGAPEEAVGYVTSAAYAYTLGTAARLRLASRRS